jgi:ceramide glucosyltransferase
VRPRGYIGTAITFGLPWALLALVLAGGASWAWVLLAITAVMRFWVAAYVSKKVLREPQTGLLGWLPARDFLAICVWVVSFVGDTVTWRGTPYTLKEGKLAKTAH